MAIKLGGEFRRNYVTKVDEERTTAQGEGKVQRGNLFVSTADTTCPVCLLVTVSSLFGRTLETVGKHHSYLRLPLMQLKSEVEILGSSGRSVLGNSFEKTVLMANNFLGKFYSCKR